MHHLEAVKRYRKVYKNWFSVLLAMRLGRERIHVVLKDGRELDVDGATAYGISHLGDFDIIDLTPDEVTFIFNNRKLSFRGYKLADIDYAFRDYSWLDVEGKAVLDVGASIGDTAIYFSIRGAKRVVAFEPYPYPYSLAKENVEANGVLNVTLVNAGVGGNDGFITVYTGTTTAWTPLRPSGRGIEVPIYSLDRVISEYGPFDVMKMDCEGCEYDAVLNSERLAEMKQVQIEYHYGPEKLTRKLKELGFLVRYSKPRKVYNSEASTYTLVGYIYAQR